MDDMSKYLTALGQSSEAVSKVDSENANLVGQANAYNLKLRNLHSEVMGASDPVGIALVAKGVEKVGAKVVNNVVSKQSQGINDQINRLRSDPVRQTLGTAEPTDPRLAGIVQRISGRTGQRDGQAHRYVGQTRRQTPCLGCPGQ